MRRKPKPRHQSKMPSGGSADNKKFFPAEPGKFRPLGREEETGGFQTVVAACRPRVFFGQTIMDVVDREPEAAEKIGDSGKRIFVHSAPSAAVDRQRKRGVFRDLIRQIKIAEPEFSIRLVIDKIGYQLHFSGLR